MKKIYLVLFCLISLAISSCKESSYAYYEQEGGDPRIDFVEFLNDSTLHWIGPGGIHMKSFYFEKDGVITVDIGSISQGRLHRIDKNTLEGEIPFFEGTWKKIK